MQQPPKFMPDKELSKVGGSLWLYILCIMIILQSMPALKC